MKKLLASWIMVVLIAGCASTDGGAPTANKKTIGTVAGAIAGGVIGSQFGKGTGQLVATAAGTLLGAYVGSEIGGQLDERDQMLAQEAEQKAHIAKVGQRVSWSNQQSGNSGSVTPVRQFRQGSSTCRDYDTVVSTSSGSQTKKGTVCRNADGSIQVVK